MILFIVLLGFYPGIVSYDGNNQWQQVQNGMITNAHPFFSTFFMLVLSKLWNNIAIIVLYQIILISITWGYFCKSINLKNKKSIIFTYFFTILVMLLPLTSIYSITVWKDTLYTCYLFLCAIILYDWSDKRYEISVIKYCFLGLALSMVYSYRHNGIIVAIMLLFIFYLICVRKYLKKSITKINFKKCFCVLVTFIAVISIISIPKEIVLNNSSKKIKNESNNEVSYSTIDGYMLWMMGAHIKEGNIKNKNDKKFLNSIIPLMEWKETYNPYLINDTSLNSSLDKKYLVNNSSKFEKIFIKYSLKYPLTILKHYLKADSLLIDPLASFHGYVYIYCFSGLWALPEYTVIKPKINLVNRGYNKLIGVSMKQPFIMFYQPAFILYLSLIITIILSKKVYGKKIWLFSLPMILNVFSLLPINLAQDLRYVYINYWTFYGLVLLCILNIKQLININDNLFDKTKF